MILKTHFLQLIFITITCSSYAQIENLKSFPGDERENAVSATGIDSYLNAKLSVYPNPVKTTLYVKLSNNKNIEKIKITSLDGQVLHTKDFSNPHHEKSIEFGNLDSGIYLLQIQGEGFSYSVKVLKE